MTLGEENKLVRENMDFPVKYDKVNKTIKDSKGLIVCDINEWARNQITENSEQQQDNIGYKIEKLLNQYEDTKPEKISHNHPEKSFSLSY